MKQTNLGIFFEFLELASVLKPTPLYWLLAWVASSSPEHSHACRLQSDGQQLERVY